ncbi:Pentatricopeptide repeat-containing protein [Vitis vinifera]|uniref:Pentatricopeptide repeat-containing protein n=1 Tax=Vitis vinifera TaxID=29760 RepID=A0A438GQJ5_VITVI|nr:Pentatricopeptide repeat-containing protein [Vitis vinifera]
MDDGFMRVKNGGEMDDKFMRIENGGEMDDGFMRIEKPLSEAWGVSNFDPVSDENPDSDNGIGSSSPAEFLAGKGYFDNMRLDAKSDEFKAMWRLVDEMIEQGFPVTARTFQILICTCGEAGLARRAVERMGLSQMLLEDYSPDILTYNIVMWNKPLAALDLLNHMKEVGFDPSVLHFTTLIDGLSRAGNLDACKYFFDEMIKLGCMPDVVCYTVMITGYIVAGELEMAQGLFEEMTVKGQLPNVFTYNSMIRGLCMAEKFEEARSMLKEMESRGCNPNFLVYNTLVGNLRNAGKLKEAHEVIRHMVDKGQYVHLLSKFKGYRRC